MADNNDAVDASNPSAWGGSWTRMVEIDADTTKFERKIDDAERLGRRFSTNLLSAFEAVAFKGKSLNDVFKSLALSMSSMVLKTAFAPLQQSFASSFAGMFKGLMPFAKGGVLQQGTPVPFAQGGVIASPMTFPLGGGRTGLAGESGPEAIMPLTRGPDGRLGVAANGGGRGAAITINIQTSDVESFNRSQTQVAAMIARAAALGQRNL